MDFSWYYFIGRKKLGLDHKEVGRLTLTLFNKLYQHYKDDFDIELRLKKSNITYEEVYRNSQKSDEWF
jgi:hypothetical protein